MCTVCTKTTLLTLLGARFDLLTCNTNPAIENTRSVGALVAGTAKMPWANADSLGCVFSLFPRIKQILIRMHCQASIMSYFTVIWPNRLMFNQQLMLRFFPSMLPSRCSADSAELANSTTPSLGWIQNGSTDVNLWNWKSVIKTTHQITFQFWQYSTIRAARFQSAYYPALNNKTMLLSDPLSSAVAFWNTWRNVTNSSIVGSTTTQNRWRRRLVLRGCRRRRRRRADSYYSAAAACQKCRRRRRDRRGVGV